MLLRNSISRLHVRHTLKNLYLFVMEKTKPRDRHVIMLQTWIMCWDYGTDIARLEGRGFEYLVRQKRTVIGRNSSRGEVDVNLGHANFISRKHIEIFFEHPDFHVLCNGKNGVYVDGFYQRKGETSLKLPKTYVL